jgi:hypothetical protein
VNVIYGLLRTNTLRRTGLIGNYLGADILFLAELTLYGKFWEIPEFLFYRRLHPAAYSSQKDKDQQIEFYNPARKQKIFLTKWRHLWENFHVVGRAPLDVTEKKRLYSYLARQAIWTRRELVVELFSAVGQLIRRI